MSKRATRASRLTLSVFILSMVTGAANNSSAEAQVYVLTVRNEELRFAVKPEAGYVVKWRENAADIGVLSGMLKDVEAVDIKPVGGLGQRGVYVVKHRPETNQNSETIAILASRSDVEYVLPLFEVEDELVAIIPEIIARLRCEDDIRQLVDFCELNECRVIRNVLYTNIEFLLEPLPKRTEDVLNIVDQLNRMDFIEWAVPDVALEVDLCGPSEAEAPDRIEPNDEYFPHQWHLDMIHAPEAWAFTQGDPNIVVAVIDDSFDIEHPDLVDNIWTNLGEIPGNGIDDDGNGFKDDVHGWNFLDGDASLSGHSCESHGTMCAGLIAARGGNGLGVTGVTWNCKIMPIRAGFGEDGCVRGMALAEAFRYAAEHGADVISNSWVLIGKYDDRFLPGVERIGSFRCTHIHSAIKDITKRDGVGRNGKGCIVLFASGNWADGGYVMYPAKYPEVIAVGAVGRSGRHWLYSGSGPELDVVAPSGYAIDCAGDLWTTDPVGPCGCGTEGLSISDEDYTNKMGGTSGACPIVAGVAALVLSLDPNLTNTEVQHLLLKSAQKDFEAPAHDPNYGFGRVDAFAAIQLMYNPLPPLYVDANNLDDPVQDGSMEHPFATIQEAINNAAPGDTVIVRPGVYTGEGNRDIDFRGRAITLLSENGPESCIIDCESKGRGFYFHSGEGADSVVDGFTITNGDSRYAIFDDGGGMYISNCSPTVANCTFSGNSAKSDGGGIYAWGSPIVTDCNFTGNSSGGYGGGMQSQYGSPVVANCTFTGNSSRYGGGMRNGSSNATVTNCVFTENSASSWGGGMLNEKGSPTVTDCTFTGNSSSQGAGMYNSSGSVTVARCIFTGNTSWHGGGMHNSGTIAVTNCTFSGNLARNDGGGMYNDPSILSVTNCTFTGNWSHNQGGGMYNRSGFAHAPIIRNCIFSGNSALTDSEIRGIGLVTYTNVQGGRSGEGNVDVDPLFVDPGYWANANDPNIVVESNDPNAVWVDGDYHLKSQVGRWDPDSESWIKDDVTSPCIDAGDPNSDWSGETWPHGKRINMGAYGGTRHASMSAAPQAMSLPRVTYVFSYDAASAQSFRSLLASYGCPTTLIGIEEVAAAPLDSYDLVIVGTDTGSTSEWGNAQSVAAIDGSGKPVIGLGEGGYCFNILDKAFIHQFRHYFLLNPLTFFFGNNS